MGDVSQELVARMIVVVCALSDSEITAGQAAHLSDEARAIVAELPAPVDPDLVAAREQEAAACEVSFPSYAALVRSGGEDKGGPVRCRYEGIRLGRQLAAEGR